MNVGTTRDIVKAFVLSRLLKKLEHRSIGDQDNLIEIGVVDSLGLMQLIEYIEGTFSIAVSDEDIVPEHFESIERITSFIEGKLGSPSRRA